jgi:hypothetical protein
MNIQNLIVAVEALVVVVVAVVGVVVEEVHRSSPTQEAHSLAVPRAHAMVAGTAPMVAGTAAGGGGGGRPPQQPMEPN